MLFLVPSTEIFLMKLIASRVWYGISESGLCTNACLLFARGRDSHQLQKTTSLVANTRRGLHDGRAIYTQAASVFSSHPHTRPIDGDGSPRHVSGS